MKAPFPTTPILGVPIHMTGFQQALAFAEDCIRGDGRGYICHVSVHGIIESQDSSDFLAALANASLAATDGMPLVWVGRWRGLAAERVYGPDFMRALLARTAQWNDRPCRHFLYGSSPDVLAALAAHITQTYPGAVLAGAISPPFRPLSEAETEADLKAIDDAATDILWVGLGAPRQELWMAANRGRLRAPLIIGVGAAFDFLAGSKRQAPRWIRSAGLEWAFRLVTEPGRLARRYGVIVPRFLGLLAREQWSWGRKPGP